MKTVDELRKNRLPNCTFGIFVSKSECESFIWGPLYDNGAEFEKPIDLGNGTFLLEYEQK